jgi:transposase
VSRCIPRHRIAQRHQQCADAHRRSQSQSRLKEPEEWLLELVRRDPDLTLEEIQRRLLDERQQKTGIGSVWRPSTAMGLASKKTVRPAEQARPDSTQHACRPVPCVGLFCGIFR